MIFSNFRIQVALTIIAVSIVKFAVADFTPDEKKAFDLAYSGSRNLDEATYDLIQHTSFQNEAHRTIALIQAFAASESPENVGKARKLAEKFLEESDDSVARDIVRIQLSSVLALDGDRKEAWKIAEQALAKTNFDRMSNADDSFIQYTIKRINLNEVSVETYLKDWLYHDIGFYYLNRPHSEGGEDLKRAFEAFMKISAREIREKGIRDARFKNHPFELGAAVLNNERTEVGSMALNNKGSDSTPSETAISFSEPAERSQGEQQQAARIPGSANQDPDGKRAPFPLSVGGIIFAVLVLLGSGGFIYWRFFLNFPPIADFPRSVDRIDGS